MPFTEAALAEVFGLTDEEVEVMRKLREAERPAREQAIAIRQAFIDNIEGHARRIEAQLAAELEHQ